MLLLESHVAYYALRLSAIWRGIPVSTIGNTPADFTVLEERDYQKQIVNKRNEIAAAGTSGSKGMLLAVLQMLLDAHDGRETYRRSIKNGWLTRMV